MKLNGLQELREHVPDLRSPARTAWVGILAVGIFSLTTIFFIYVNRIIPLWAPDGQIIVFTIGFLLVRMFFTNKENYIVRYGELAYRNAFGRFALPGLALIFAPIAYIGYIPGPGIPISWWAIVTPVLGWYFALVGVTLWLRAVFTFGLDNLAMLYVYFPGKGRRVDNSIYGVLRHPVYAGALRLGLGLAFLNGNIFAIIFGLLILPFGLTAWVRLVEEKELLERFGTDYAEYRKSTPAFWPRPRDLGKFFRFLLGG